MMGKSTSAHLKKIILVVSFVLLPLILGGCLKEEAPKSTKREPVVLTYYKMFDDRDVFLPLIQKFQAKNPHIQIRYKKFTNFDEYQRLILNELAEGEGPDLFAMPNTWLGRNTKKLTPAPLDFLQPSHIEPIFVSTALKNIVYPDVHDKGAMKVFGLPLTVDTLGLYYNQNHFDDALPEKGRPSATWEGLKEDVFRLTKSDNSFERFFRSGIALGRHDNISRAVDIMYLLFLQYKGEMYKNTYRQTGIAESTGLPPSQPGVDALELFTSFAISTNKNYAWNEFIASPSVAEKELEAFIKGKTSMVINYAFAYDQMKQLITTYQRAGVQPIALSSIKTAPIPQVFDPKVSPDKRTTYASFFTEVVSRTSKHPREAWQFLVFLTSKENMQYYFDKTHNPTSRRDLIPEQAKDPIYGTFVNQIGYAESFPIYDANSFETIFKDAIDEVLKTGRPVNAIRTAANRIGRLLPQDKPFVPQTPPPQATQPKK